MVNANPKGMKRRELKSDRDRHGTHALNSLVLPLAEPHEH
jgi:hypothetical protein